MTPSDSEIAGPRIRVMDLTMAYGDFVIQRNLTFAVKHGEVFIIMGGSGCGKSTLLRPLIGLIRPAKGDVFFDGESFWGADDEQRQQMVRRFGVLYQSGAVWSSMTLAENIGLPVGEFTDHGVDRAVAGDSRVGAEALRALRDVADAARSLKTLANYLERHPDALLRGKGSPESK